VDWQSLFSGLAVLVTACGVGFQLKQAGDRSKWESEQTTRRENFEKRQLEKQQAWEASQDAQRQRERKEDLARIERDSRPQIKVTVTAGARQWGPMMVPILHLGAQNTGKVLVYLDAPMMQTPDQMYLHFILDSEVNLHNWENVHYSEVKFPVCLQPTQSCQVLLTRSSIEDNLKQEHSGRVVVIGTYRDGAGNLYESDPYEIDLDRPSQPYIAAR